MRVPVPVVLEGSHVRLEPLRAEHLPELVAAVGADGDELFRWMSMWRPTTGPVLEALVVALDRILAANSAGTLLTWALRSDGAVVGSTSYLDVSVPDCRLEVGATWVARPHWRTRVNSATKLLVLGHAFDELGAERVALKTDAENLRSQRAIERLGAVREGVLRHHIRRPDGTWRDTVYYSILRAEWPAARERLRASVRG